MISNTLADGGKWTCSKCGKTFAIESEIKDHVIQCLEIKCEFCQKKFKLRQHLKRHIEKISFVPFAKRDLKTLSHLENTN